MQGERTYGIAPSSYFFLAGVIFATVIGVIVAVSGGFGPRREGPPLAFILYWVAIVGVMWFQVLRTPYRLVLRPDGQMEVRAIARRLTVLVESITLIKGDFAHTGAVIRAGELKVRLLALPRETFDFLTELRRLNPKIRIERL